MRFRRQSNDGAQWVTVSHEGGVVTAAAVSHADAQRSRVDWLWQARTSSLSEGLRALVRTAQWRDQRLLGVLGRGQCKLLATEAPDVPRTEWRDALRWPLRDHVDFPMEDALVDVLAVPQDTSARQTSPVIAVAVARAAYNEVELAADDVGHHWAALEVVETALRNLSAMAERDGQAHALMAFGQDHGVLVITYQGALVMARQIDVPVASLLGDVGARDATLNRVALEVVRTIDSFERLHSQIALSELSVLSPSHLGNEVVGLLSEQVYIPVKACNLADWVDLSALGEQADRLSRHATLSELAAIGAGLRVSPRLAGLQHLDLLDRSSALTRDPAWGARLGIKLAAAVAGACLVGGVGLSALLARTNAQAGAVEAELTPLQKSLTGLQEPRILKDLRALQDKQTAQRELIDALQANLAGASLGYSGYLRALGRQAQSSLWVTGLTIAGDAQDIELRGRMLSAAVLPNYLQSLQSEPLFAGRRFAQLEVKALPATDDDAGASEFVLRTRAGSEAAATSATPASAASQRAAAQVSKPPQDKAAGPASTGDKASKADEGGKP